MELVGGEKVAVTRGCDSGDEDSGEPEDGPQEGFTLKQLFMPSHKSPTLISGNIVYATTAIICKCPSVLVGCSLVRDVESPPEPVWSLSPLSLNAVAFVVVPVPLSVACDQ